MADFLWSELRAVLEIDSTEYHLSPRDHGATLERDQVLQAAGYAVLHMEPSQLRDPAAFVRIVGDWLASLARRALIISGGTAGSGGSARDDQRMGSGW